MSPQTQPGDVNEQDNIASEALLREITRYLAAVDDFRAELCEPTWLPEGALSGTPPVRRLLKREGLVEL